MPAAEVKKVRQFPCKQCGASLEFKPDAETLTCTHCGFKEVIPKTPEQIKEYAYNAQLARATAHGYGEPKRTAKCPRCAAQTAVDMVVDATRCAFCGTPMVIVDAISAGLDQVIQPEAVLPFKIERSAAEQSFRGWVRSRWFAPTMLRNFSALEKMIGLYRPFWTFDAHTSSAYSGERGDRH